MAVSHSHDAGAADLGPETVLSEVLPLADFGGFRADI